MDTAKNGELDVHQRTQSKLRPSLFLSAGKWPGLWNRRNRRVQAPDVRTRSTLRAGSFQSGLT
jgi:hypothetical protein